KPGSGTLFADIGWTYFAEGALDKALVYFEKARAAEPGDCNHVYAIAWTWLTRGDETRGREALAEVERLCPGAPQVSEYLKGRAGTTTVLDSTEPSTARALRNLTALERSESYTLRDLAVDALRELRSTPDFDAAIDRRIDALLARRGETIWDAFRAHGVSALEL